MSTPESHELRPMSPPYTLDLEFGHHPSTSATEMLSQTDHDSSTADPSVRNFDEATLVPQPPRSCVLAGRKVAERYPLALFALGFLAGTGTMTLFESVTPQSEGMAYAEYRRGYDAGMKAGTFECLKGDPSTHQSHFSSRALDPDITSILNGSSGSFGGSNFSLTVDGDNRLLVDLAPHEHGDRLVVKPTAHANGPLVVSEDMASALYDWLSEQKVIPIFEPHETD